MKIIFLISSFEKKSLRIFTMALIWFCCWFDSAKEGIDDDVLFVLIRKRIGFTLYWNEARKRRNDRPTCRCSGCNESDGVAEEQESLSFKYDDDSARRIKMESFASSCSTWRRPPRFLNDACVLWCDCCSEMRAVFADTCAREARLWWKMGEHEWLRMNP